MSTVTAGIDLLSSTSFAGGHPVEQYRWLQENAPVFWHAEPGGAGFWAVTSYELVREASTQPRTFSSAEGGVLIGDLKPDALACFRTMMLVMDPPQHSFHRRLVSTVLTPERAVGWRGPIARTVGEILDEVSGRGECDLVSDVAAKLPVYVISELVGIPRADGVRLHELAGTMHSAPDAISDERRHSAMREIAAYAAEVRAEKLAAPSEDDLTTGLVTAEIDGRRLTEREFGSFFMLLLNAGGDATRNLVGGAILSLLRRPSVSARLRADLAGLMPAAVEELLRFQSPVIYMRRTATSNAELGGVSIAAGDKLALYYGAANRDPEVFDRPDELIIDRVPNEHLAFGGGGPHTCLGAHLGRIEATEMLSQLLVRFDDLTLDGEPTWLASNVMSGPACLPVRWTPAAPAGG